MSWLRYNYKQADRKWQQIVVTYNNDTCAGKPEVVLELQ